MISLKTSRFLVEYNEEADDGYKVFTRSSSGCKDVTDILTDEEKIELISDLVYAITDLLDKGE